MEKYSKEIEIIIRFPNVNSAILDFGIEISEDSVAHSDRLPLTLLKAVANAGLDIQLSYYICSEDDDDE